MACRCGQALRIQANWGGGISADSQFRSRGQIEAAVCAIVTKLYRELTGRGPDRVSASIDRGMLLIRLQGILTCVESRLLDADVDASRGEALVKAMRERFVDRVRSSFIEALSATVGRTPRCLFHDVAPSTDEEVFVVTFPSDDRAPRT